MLEQILTTLDKISNDRTITPEVKTKLLRLMKKIKKQLDKPQ